MVQFGEFLKTWSLQSNSVTRQVTFNWWKIPKLENSNVTFWVIFIHCEVPKSHEMQKNREKLQNSDFADLSDFY